VLLPIGTFQKPEIRELARQSGLRVADKKDSYEICFVPDNDYVRFVREKAPVRDTGGVIVDREGQILGEHSGFEAFTVGQRRGIGIAAKCHRQAANLFHQPKCRIAFLFADHVAQNPTQPTYIVHQRSLCLAESAGQRAFGNERHSGFGHPIFRVSKGKP
jgi:tRNA U34 2-thiouridine synthase MnmA/TrmU